MTAVRIFTPENRLAKVVQSLHGETFDDLVVAADSRVESLADGIRRYVGEKVGEIETIHRQGEVAVFGECLSISATAMNIAEVAAAAKRDAIGDVARGICEMVDGLVSSGVWHSDALELHLTALTLLNGERAPDKEEASRIVARLSDMREAIGAAR